MLLVPVRFSAIERERLDRTKELCHAPLVEIVRGLVWDAIERGEINPHYPITLVMTSDQTLRINLPQRMGAGWRELCDRHQVSCAKGTRQLIWAYPLIDDRLPVLAYPKLG